MGSKEIHANVIGIGGSFIERAWKGRARRMSSKEVQTIGGTVVELVVLVFDVGGRSRDER